jgi:hypothetical protein
LPLAIACREGFSSDLFFSLMTLDTASLELAARDARGLAMDAITKCKTQVCEGVVSFRVLY